MSTLQAVDPKTYIPMNTPSITYRAHTPIQCSNNGAIVEAFFASKSQFLNYEFLPHAELVDGAALQPTWWMLVDFRRGIA